MRVGTLILALVMIAGNQLNAQGVSLGPSLGYQRAADADEGRLMVGAALRMKLSPALGVEGSINYRREKYADGLLTVRSWPVMITGLLYPIPNLYGAIGAGWYNTTFDFDRDELPLVSNRTKQEFGWHFGGGVELPVNQNVKLTGDIRYVFLDYDFEELPGSGDTKSNFYMITVGLLFDL
jgi:opacity protein-like surface antigen